MQRRLVPLHVVPSHISRSLALYSDRPSCLRSCGGGHGHAPFQWCPGVCFWSEKTGHFRIFFKVCIPEMDSVVEALCSTNLIWIVGRFREVAIRGLAPRMLLGPSSESSRGEFNCPSGGHSTIRDNHDPIAGSRVFVHNRADAGRPRIGQRQSERNGADNPGASSLDSVTCRPRAAGLMSSSIP